MSGDRFPFIIGILGLIDALIGIVIGLISAVFWITLGIIVIAVIAG